MHIDHLLHLLLNIKRFQYELSITYNTETIKKRVSVDFKDICLTKNIDLLKCTNKIDTGSNCFEAKK
jgi:hypothetical protein